MRFHYLAYTTEQGVLNGKIEAADLEEVRAEIARQGYKPLRITEARHPLTLEALFPSLFKVGAGEVIRFSRQVAVMLGSGASLERALTMLQAETTNRTMRRTIEDIRTMLYKGESFSSGLARHPKHFDNLFVRVAEVGEYTGQLGPALDRMADVLEREREARRKAAATLIYPLATIGLSLITLFVLVTVALPPLLKTFEQMDAKVPLMTRAAVSGANSLKTHYLELLLGAAGVVLGLKVARRVPRLSHWLDLMKARAPLIGAFVVVNELARFSRTLAMLLEAGVPLVTALRLATSSAKNLAIRRAFTDAEESIMTGHTVSEALKRHPILPMLFVQLVTIGEESNALARTMGDAAQAYQKQLEQRLAALLGTLEPLATIFVGAIVGFIAMSMFVPIYSAMDALK